LQGLSRAPPLRHGEQCEAIQTKPPPQSPSLDRFARDDGGRMRRLILDAALSQSGAGVPQSKGEEYGGRAR
jgi:hypothetical protein